MRIIQNKITEYKSPQCDSCGLFALIMLFYDEILDNADLNRIS